MTGTCPASSPVDAAVVCRVLARAASLRGLAVPSVGLCGVGRWGSKREREFAAGRRAARRALGRLSPPASRLEIVKAPGGAPVVAAPFTLSVSHSNGIAVAVAAERRGRGHGLGVDLERVRALDVPRFVPKIASPAEWARALGAGRDDTMTALLLFSVKEALWKAFGGRPGVLAAVTVDTWEAGRAPDETPDETVDTVGGVASFGDESAAFVATGAGDFVAAFACAAGEAAGA